MHPFLCPGGVRPQDDDRVGGAGEPGHRGPDDRGALELGQVGVPGLRSGRRQRRVLGLHMRPGALVETIEVGDLRAGFEEDRREAQLGNLQARLAINFEDRPGRQAV